MDMRRGCVQKFGDFYMINLTPKERENKFRSLLEKRFPHLARLQNRIDECTDGKDVIKIDANFASELEEDIFKLVVEGEIQAMKIRYLQENG